MKGSTFSINDVNYLIKTKAKSQTSRIKELFELETLSEYYRKKLIQLRSDKFETIDILEIKVLFLSMEIRVLYTSFLSLSNDDSFLAFSIRSKIGETISRSRYISFFISSMARLHSV